MALSGNMFHNIPGLPGHCHWRIRAAIFLVRRARRAAGHYYGHVIFLRMQAAFTLLEIRGPTQTRAEGEYAGAGVVSQAHLCWDPTAPLAGEDGAGMRVGTRFCHTR